MAFKLLICDDNAYVVEVLQKRLKQEGYEVVAACDGAEALRKLEQDNPDIILLDLIMPNVNGLDVLKEIKRKKDKELDKWRPVIIISAKDELDSESTGDSKSEADFYLNKPCSIEDILGAIKKMASMLPP